MSLPAELLDIISISLRRRDPARRSVWLLQKSCLGKVGHHIPYGRRTQPFTAGARKRARTHRLSAGNEGFDDGGQDFAFPPANWPCWHISIRVSGANRHCKFFRYSGLD